VYDAGSFRRGSKFLLKLEVTVVRFVALRIPQRLDVRLLFLQIVILFLLTAGTAAAQTTVTTPGGTANTIPKFSSSSTIVNSQISDSGGLVSLNNLALKSLNNVLFADKFSSVQAAINACQSISAVSPVSGGTIGCTIYATSASVNTSLGSLDPGSNTVRLTIYLGPFDFTATQITLRADFRIIGSGIGHTTITSVGTNAQNLIVFPQSNNYGVSGVLLQDIRFYGASGNTSQEGLSSDVSTLTTSQLSYSRFVGLTGRRKLRNSV
jgi:hypothetical protein